MIFADDSSTVFLQFDKYYFFNSLLDILIGLELLIKTTTLLILTNICMKLKLMRTKIFNTLFSPLPLMTKMNVSSLNGRNDLIQKLFSTMTSYAKCVLCNIFWFSASRIRYEITRGNFGGAFAVKNMTGAIYVAGPLDYENRKRVSTYYRIIQNGN